MKFTLYRADCTGQPGNTCYPHETVVTTAEELREAVRHDTVYARYCENSRSNQNFIRSDVIPMDCDNDHTEEPEGWIGPDRVAELLPDVSYAIVPSRNNNLPKKGRAPRPKFHIFFPVAEITDAEDYAALKRAIHRTFPFFDSNAMDAARFFFGSDNGPAVWHEGPRMITDAVTPAAPECLGAPESMPDSRNHNVSPGIRQLQDAVSRILKKCAEIDSTAQQNGWADASGSSGSTPTTAAHPADNADVAPATRQRTNNSTLAPNAAAQPTTDNSVSVSATAQPPLRTHTIPEGFRNSTLSRFASRVLKRYGICEEAWQLFCEEAAKCEPPLGQAELNTIWHSAVKFAKKVTTQPDYVQPADFAASLKAYAVATPERRSLEPEDYSDVGQAVVLAREYGGELLYTDGTGYLRYDGSVWQESGQAALGAIEEFLDLQLQDALDTMQRTRNALLESGVSKEAIDAGGKTLDKAIGSDDQQGRLEAYLDARNYYLFVLKRRDMKYITATLQAARAMLEVKISDLDKDEFLLNTTDGTYDLRLGMAGRKDHDSQDHITKMTACEPGEQGRELWLEALQTFFCGDRELIDYVQRIVGMAAVGKVYIEAMIIAYGDGSNGKSTFWNTISRVLGTYGGRISADTLTTGCKRNVRPEMAELKGKRLIIASELEEGNRLNTATVKQLCSTDEITAEKKYKDPFQYVPSHTLVLYTNHLPKVGASDTGTWRRLIVIPFKAEISGTSDIKNYTDYLVDNAAPYILQWIIEGAQKIIGEKYRITPPQVVTDAIGEYREENDWLSMFLEECCDVGKGLVQKSGELYQEYRAYCLRMGEFARNTTDFYTALSAAGFEKKVTNKGRMIMGLAIKNVFS